MKKKILAVSVVSNLQAPKKASQAFLLMLIFQEAEDFGWAHRQIQDSISCYFLEHAALKEASEECCSQAELLDARLPS